MDSDPHIPRVVPVSPGTRPELAGIEAAIKEQRYGEIPLLYKVLLNSAPIASGWEKLLTAVRHHTQLKPAHREMIILRIAVLNRATFEYAAHLPLAQNAGIDDAKIEGLRQARLAPELYCSVERAILQLVDQMTERVEVPAADIDALRPHYDNRGLVELVSTIAAYNMVSRFLVALNIVHRP